MKSSQSRKVFHLGDRAYVAGLGEFTKVVKGSWISDNKTVVLRERTKQESPDGVELWSMDYLHSDNSAVIFVGVMI